MTDDYKKHIQADRRYSGRIELLRARISTRNRCISTMNRARRDMLNANGKDYEELKALANNVKKVA